MSLSITDVFVAAVITYL